MDKDNKITVQTTGAFELRDPIQDIDIGETPIAVRETSFVSQMIGLKRLKVTKGEVTQETPPTNINPSVGEALPVKDDEPTITELKEKAAHATRGRPPRSK